MAKRSPDRDEWVKWTNKWQGRARGHATEAFTPPLMAFSSATSNGHTISIDLTAVLDRWQAEGIARVAAITTEDEVAALAETTGTRAIQMADVLIEIAVSAAGGSDD